ncbi:WD repeat-containing protein KIAA1875-like isoform X3 [Fopius arisanus]|nr:PREDICTED: WD repeat-containing protein KIAA1875-like isoform X3 [Fopius arisanus]
MIHRFSIQGKPVQPSFNLSTTMAFTRFIWFPETKVFAGFAPHDDLIWILEPSCKLIQIVRNEFRVENIFYTPYTNEMLVIGTTKATRFPMDHKEQTLNSWKTVNISDSSFGPTWVLELSSLIQHDPEFLRLAGSYLTTLYVIPLTSDKDEESNVPVKFLARRINSMETAITVLYFHPTSQWIITGDQRGSICAWNLNLECMMNCPTGHQKAVKIITGHPSICGFISCAEDDIIQAWSCNLREKIESFSELGEVSLIAINSSASSVAAVGTKLSCFQMHQLYTFYSPLTSNPVILFSTTSPIDAVRVIIFSADKIVRILSSSSGKQLNIHILPITFTVVSIAHSDITDRMYVLGTNGIVVASTKTNPMEIEEEWDNASKIITCLLVYDHYEAIRTSAHEIERSKLVNPICARIIIGTQAGELILIDETSGEQGSSISAHDGAIIHLCSSIISRQVVSSSIDKSIKIWRIFPDTLVPLTILHQIYYTTPISNIGSIGFTICVVSSAESSECHQLFMYDTIERRQLQHHPSKDHVKQILALDTLESLQICVTSSMDGTLRIWDHHNDLVKVLEINVCTSQITFSSLLGDIVFSAGKHLYRLPYENYLPPKYRLQISYNEMNKEEEEHISDASEPIDQYLEIEEQILHPVSSVPLGSLDPTIEAPSLDQIFKEQICMQLKYRDEDIKRIQENILHAKKVVKMKTLMEHLDWERHIAELLGVSSKTENESSPHDIANYAERYEKIKKVFNKSQRSRMIGCSIKQFSDREKFVSEISGSSLNLGGFVPNSLVIKIADGRNKEVDQLETHQPMEKRQIKYVYPSEIYLTIDSSTSKDSVKHTHQDSLEGVL